MSLRWLILTLAALTLATQIYAGKCPFHAGLDSQGEDEDGEAGIIKWGPHVLTVDCGESLETDWSCQATVVLPGDQLVRVAAGASDEDGAKIKLDAVITDMLTVHYQHHHEQLAKQQEEEEEEEACANSQ